MKRKLLTSLVLLMAALPAMAQDTAAEKPFVSSTQTIQFTAEVVAVDRENYTVTLKGPEGGQRTLELGEEARRLDEVEVGDTVMGEILQHLDIEVVSVENAEAGSGVMVAQARAPENERPGLFAAETMISTAVVEEINQESGTFKLKWEDGVKEYVARDPENLKRAEVGDMVVVTYTDAIALQLQEVAPE